MISTSADRFEYVVEGIGDFPLDMLRHDCAYPADQQSVTAIMAGLRWGGIAKAIARDAPGATRVGSGAHIGTLALLRLDRHDVAVMRRVRQRTSATVVSAHLDCAP